MGEHGSGNPPGGGGDYRVMDDAGSARLAREGDRGAFAVLVGRHGRCGRRALAGAGDRGVAEDAAQEAVLQAMVGLDRLERPERFGARLGGIGLNVADEGGATRHGGMVAGRATGGGAGPTRARRAGGGGRAGRGGQAGAPGGGAAAGRAAGRGRPVLPGGDGPPGGPLCPRHRRLPLGQHPAAQRQSRPPRGAGGLGEGGAHGGPDDRAGDHAGDRGAPAATGGRAAREDSHPAHRGGGGAAALDLGGGVRGPPGRLRPRGHRRCPGRWPTSS